MKKLQNTFRLGLSVFVACSVLFASVNVAIAQVGNIPGGQNPGQPGGVPGAPPPEAEFDPFEGPNSQTFEALNPLSLGGNEDVSQPQASAYKDALSTPGGIVSRLLVFSFPMAGLILFTMIVWGGGEILAGAASKKSVDAGKQRITAAIVGFLLLFSSYWIIQIVEIIFGVVIF